MAHLLKAHLYGLATEPGAAAELAKILDHVRDLPADDRERSHIAVLRLLVQRNWVAAAVAMDFHNVRYPRDLLALQSGHTMDFFRANARDMRDRIARALPHWPASVPGHSIVLGMYAFGLEETGDYARAEAMGREAVADRSAGLLGPPRGGARHGDAGARRGRHRLDDRARALLVR